MSEKKVIAVLGATGAQGGGLVRSILADSSGEFSVRALTRDTSSEKAQALAAMGAEVVAADVDSQESLERAFAGAWGAYCVTFFWDHFSPERELRQARLMADAAAASGLEYVIWSTLEDTRNWMSLDDARMPTLQGKYKVPHFDAKGEADATFLAGSVPATCLWTSFYWDNLIHFGMGPRRGEDGKLMFGLPMGEKRLPGIAAEDIGRCAYGIYRRAGDYAGQKVGIAGEHPTGNEMADVLSEAFGEEVSYAAIPFDVYRGLGFPGADDLGNMFQFKHDFEEDFCRVRDVAFSRELNPKLQSFRDWVMANKDRIPVQE